MGQSIRPCTRSNGILLQRRLRPRLHHPIPTLLAPCLQTTFSLFSLGPTNSLLVTYIMERNRAMPNRASSSLQTNLTLQLRMQYNILRRLSIRSLGQLHHTAAMVSPMLQPLMHPASLCLLAHNRPPQPPPTRTSTPAFPRLQIQIISQALPWAIPEGQGHLGVIGQGTWPPGQGTCLVIPNHKNTSILPPH